MGGDIYHAWENEIELVRNLAAHGDAWEGKWRGNWRMEWVASTLKPPPNVVYPALLKLTRTPRLPAIDWTDAPTDLNGLVLFRGKKKSGFCACAITFRTSLCSRLGWKCMGDNNNVCLKEIDVFSWLCMRPCRKVSVLEKQEHVNARRKMLENIAVYLKAECFFN